MKLRLLVLFIGLCGFAKAQQSIDTSFAFQTATSKMLSIYIPSTYSASTPNKMMIGFHPFNVGVWNSQSWRDTLITLAETHGLILMCPDGGSNGIVDDAIDTAFTSVMCDSMANWYNIDPDAIYATGFSVGGRATYTYMLNHPGKIAGGIPIGAAINGTSQVNSTLQSNATCKPIYIVHGGNDSPNTRYYPVRTALISAGAWINSNLMSGIGHTIGFTNFNSVISTAYVWVDSLNSMALTPEAGLNDTICSNNNYVLGGDPILGGSCPYTFQWAPNYNLSSSTASNPVASPDSTTTYFVTITDGDGTISTDSVVITVLESPTVEISSDSMSCAGDTVVMTVTGADSYAWSQSSTLSCLSCSVTEAYPNFPVTYTVTGTAANGCTATDQQFLLVNPSPQASAVPAMISACEGVDVPIALTSNNGIANLNWNDTSYLSCNCATPTYTVGESTTLIASFSDAAGLCYGSTEIMITALDTPEVSIHNAVALCVSEANEVLINTNPNGTYDYQWSSGANTSAITLSPTQSGYEFVTVTSADGCSLSDSMFVEYFDFESELSISFVDQGLDSCVKAYVPQLDSLTTGVSSYQWSVSGVIVSDSSTLVLYFPNGILGSSMIELEVALENGCTLYYIQDDHGDVCALGVNDLQAPTFEVFPNPTDGKFTLSFDNSEERQIQVLNLKGNVVLTSKAVSNTHDLDLSNMASGVYMLRVQDAQSASVSRIIKH
jgi:hypothetical protein